MKEISWKDFEKIEFRTGKIISVKKFSEARKKAFKLTVDFGVEVGIKKSSAQITDLYTAEELLNKHVVAVINFSPKKIGPFISECLVTGFHNEDNEVILCVPDKQIPLGAKLC